MASVQLYHERQDAGLCGVHCLNNLLQGTYYSEVDLMEIAHGLDAAERAVMSEMGTDTSDFVKFISEDSGNVADDGNYSVQVLSEALKSFDMVVGSINSPEMKGVLDQPQKEQGFICNLQAHWFAIRKLQGHWWDLNSLLKTPNHLTELYLGVYLKQLQLEGYSIFVVRGHFPSDAAFDPTNPNVKRVGLPRRNSTATNDDDELQKALKASLAQQMGMDVNDMDSDMMAAITASLEESGSQGSSQNSVSTNPRNNTEVKFTPPDVTIIEDDEDEILRQALEMSKQTNSNVPQNSNSAQNQQQATVVTTEVKNNVPPKVEEKKRELHVPEEPAADTPTSNITKMVIRLPNGTRAERKFLKTNTLQQVFDWIQSQQVEVDLTQPNKFKLISSFPRREYTEANKTLEELALHPSASLNVLDFK
jgi:ataxin-3